MSDSSNFPKNPYAGGRYLKSVVKNKNLKTLEKLLLLTIGNELDFRDISTSQRYISNETLSEYLSMSVRTIQRLTSKLSAEGYLVKNDRFDENNRQQSNVYSLSPKVFIEYVNSPEGDRQSGGRVTDSHTNLPNKELPKEKPISTNVDIGEKEPVLESTDSPTNLEDHKNEPKKIRKPRKAIRPKVTQSHQKIAQIFRPDSRYVSNVYFDKSAVFFVIDEFLEKYGDKGHEVISLLYEYCKSNDMCGKSKFNLTQIKLALNAAIAKFG